MSTTEVAAPSSKLLIKRLSDKATLPTRGSPFSAGLDLYAAEAKTIPSRGKALITTALSLSLPYGTYGRVAPRSGLASKHSLQTGAGVVDSDYRGTLFVLLFNHGEVDYEVKEGERIAQLIVEKVEMCVVEEVETLDETVRGSGGFGSTGGFGATATVVEVAPSEAAV